MKYHLSLEVILIAVDACYNKKKYSKIWYNYPPPPPPPPPKHTHKKVFSQYQMGFKNHELSDKCNRIIHFHVLCLDQTTVVCAVVYSVSVVCVILVVLGSDIVSALEYTIAEYICVISFEYCLMWWRYAMEILHYWSNIRYSTGRWWIPLTKYQ